MNNETTIPVNGEKGIDRPNVTAMMKEMSCVAGDVTGTVYKISQHMFGLGEPEQSMKAEEPKCFRDDMDLMVKRMKLIREELYRISEMLGVE